MNGEILHEPTPDVEVSGCDALYAAALLALDYLSSEYFPHTSPTGTERKHAVQALQAAAEFYSEHKGTSC